MCGVSCIGMGVECDARRCFVRVVVESERRGQGNRSLEYMGEIPKSPGISPLWGMHSTARSSGKGGGGVCSTLGAGVSKGKDSGVN